MERLLADAEKITGVHYDINELGDVYDAIHVIQGELGITGTTAEEAASTISGSIGMMKASWQDLLGNLALGNDIYPQMEALAESVIAVIRNVVPAVWNIITGIPRMIIEHWPEIVSAVSSGVSSLIAYVQSNWPMWVQTVFATLQQIGLAIINGLPGLLARANELLQGVFAWLSSNWPVLISKVWELLLNLGGTLLSRLPSILLKLGQLLVTLVKGILTTAWNTALLSFQTILSGIGQFALNVLQKLRSGLSTVWNVITSPFRQAKETLDGIISKIKGLFPIRLGNIFNGIKLPHFNISGGKLPWGIGGKGKAPSVSVEWYAKGGIMTKPTLFGGGEAGAEAIMPLDPFWAKLDRMADGIYQMADGQGMTVNVYGTAGMDVNELADAVERRIIEIQNRRRLAWQ